MSAAQLLAALQAALANGLDPDAKIVTWCDVDVWVCFATETRTPETSDGEQVFAIVTPKHGEALEVTENEP